MSVQYGVPLDPKKYAVKWPYSWWAFVCFVFFLLLGLVVFFWALFSDDLPADGTFASFVFSMVAAWAGISFICSISVLLAGMSIFLWRVLVGRRGYAFQDMSGRTTRS